MAASHLEAAIFILGSSNSHILFMHAHKLLQKSYRSKVASYIIAIKFIFLHVVQFFIAVFYNSISLSN